MVLSERCTYKTIFVKVFIGTKGVETKKNDAPKSAVFLDLYGY